MLRRNPRAADEHEGMGFVVEEDAAVRLQEEFLEGLRQIAVARPGEELLYAAPSRSTRRPAPPEAGRPTYSHIAEGVEIAVAREGAALIVASGQIFRVAAGRLLVIDRGVYHAELPAAADRGHRVFWCHLQRNQVILADSTYSPTRGYTTPDMRLAGPTDVERIADGICAELTSRGLGYDQAVFGLLTYLAWLLIRRVHRGQVVVGHGFESPVPLGDRRTWLAIQSALAFCEENFRTNVSREDIAKAVGYSPGHLGHLVSSHLGQSLSDYLRNLRITEAKRLLQDSDAEVREIAASVGYSDPAHFTRAFRRVTGLSPTDFRRRAEVV